MPSVDVHSATVASGSESERLENRVEVSTTWLTQIFHFRMIEATVTTQSERERIDGTHLTYPDKLLPVRIGHVCI